MVVLLQNKEQKLTFSMFEGVGLQGSSGPYLNKAHLSHSFLVMVVHLTDQSVAQVDRDPLDGLVLPCWLQDLQQQLVDPGVLELQLLRDTEVAQSQAAVPLDLDQDRK